MSKLFLISDEYSVVELSQYCVDRENTQALHMNLDRDVNILHCKCSRGGNVSVSV